MEGLELMTSSLIKRGFWYNKRVLLTGHTGFKGSWLALWLNELGAKVTGVALEPEEGPNLFNQSGLKKRILRHHITDIRDLKAIGGIIEETQPEVVFHLAAQALVRRSYKDPIGTWAVNVQGSLNILEALKPLKRPCAVVMVTTDKVYENKEWEYGYRENDRLGGHDPYSASKAAAEIAINSWASSFCGTDRHQTPYLAIATARAGNVIGGGDWAVDRIVPDAMRALAQDEIIEVRNPLATRPWQHVLEPLSGYIKLAEYLAKDNYKIKKGIETFNFGPKLEANKTVEDLISEIMKHWSGRWKKVCDANEPHEAKLLHLQIDKAHHRLGWNPRWDFKETVERTVKWYRTVERGGSAVQSCLEDIMHYQKTTHNSV